MEGHRHFASMARGMESISLIDAAEPPRHPLISTSTWLAVSGRLTVTSIRHSCVRRWQGAPEAGAEVHRHAGDRLTQHRDDSWTVHTGQGDIDAEIVVNAGGTG